METNDDYAPNELLEFITSFNDGEYGASLGALVPAWQHSAGDDFYKGLIQLAGAFQHWSDGNTFWAEDLLASSYNLLERYAPAYEGLNVDQLLRDIQRCNAIARDANEAGSTGESSDIPTIRLTQSP